MEHNPNQPSATERVLAQIRENKVSMRPKIFFTLKAALVLLVAGIILLVSVGIVNFVAFGLRVNGHESLLAFGPRGILAFLVIFPWPLVVIDALLVILLEELLRRFRFVYRSPMLYILLGLVACALSLGLALDRATPLNDDLLQRADHDHLPGPLQSLYESERAPAPHAHGIFRGTVTDIATTTLIMKHDDHDADSDDGVYVVEPPPGAHPSDFVVGERLYVAGDVSNGVVHAYGIGTLPPEMK